MSFEGLDRKTLLDIRGTTRDRIFSLKISKVDEGQQTEVANVIAELEAEVVQIDTKLAELVKADAGKASLDTTLSDEVTSEYQLSRIITNSYLVGKTE